MMTAISILITHETLSTFEEKKTVFSLSRCLYAILSLIKSAFRHTSNEIPQVPYLLQNRVWC